MGHRFAATSTPVAYKGGTGLGNPLRVSKNSRRV
jgi:hypothetical protein